MTSPWIEWNGGENPVPGKMVRLTLRGYPTVALPPKSADSINWANDEKIPRLDIVAYQLVEDGE